MIVRETDVERICKEINNANEVALDFETVSLVDKTPVAFSFAYGDKVYFVPIKMKYFINLPFKVYLKLIITLANHENLIFHHAAFDLQVLDKMGVSLKISPHDTLILSHLVDENGSHKLKDLVKEYLDYDMIKYKDVCGTGKKQIEFRDVKDKKLAEKYASDDAEQTLRLFKLLYPKVRNDSNLAQAYDEVERPLLLVVNDMHLHGVPINKEKIDIISTKCDKFKDFYKGKLDIYMSGVNLNSPKQLREYFIDKKHMPVLKRSRKTNEPSVDSEVLEKYAGKHNCMEADWILKYRYYSKILTTFVPALTPNLPDGSGVIHPHFHQVGTTSGRFSSSNPNCISLDTEVLTPEGWKKYNEINIGDRVYQWDSGSVELTKVMNKYIGRQKGLRFHNKHVDICASINHRQVFQDRKTKEFKVRTMNNFLKDAYILHGGKLDKQVYNRWLMRFNVAVQADGSICKYYIDFSFTKKRKSLRLLKILSALSINFVDVSNKGRYRYCVYGKNLLYYLNSDKTFNTNCIELGKDFIEELFYWDGLYTRRSNYASKEEHNIDIVQAAAALTGEYRTHKRVYVNKFGSISHQLDITRRNYSLTSSNAGASIGKFTSISNLNVWAISVPSSFIICRRNGKVFVTGNCQNIPQGEEFDIRSAIEAPEGYTFVGADYSQMELRFAAYESKDKNMINTFNSGKDIHAETANKVGCDRRQAKCINFAILYGVGVRTLSKMLESTSQEAQTYIHNYYKAYPQLQLWLRQKRQDALDKGYLQLFLGRKRHLPNNFDDQTDWQKGGILRSMVNAVIQGGCANAMKKAMVVMHNDLKKFNAHVLAQIHDEVLVMCKDENAEEVKKIVEQAMLKPVQNLGVKFEVDVNVGKTWSKVH